MCLRSFAGAFIVAITASLVVLVLEARKLPGAYLRQQNSAQV
jgi:hypothetical protein